MSTVTGHQDGFTFYITGMIECDTCRDRLMNQCDDDGEGGVMCDFDTWRLAHGPDVCLRIDYPWCEFCGVEPSAGMNEFGVYACATCAPKASATEQGLRYRP
mgnify:CR=1 FL=1